jgi:hypothetical protein
MAVAMVLACVVGAPAAAGAQEPRNQRGRQAFRAEVTDREVRSLALGPDGLLALSNMVGDITVRTGEGADIRLEIRRLSRGATEADARLGLERVRVRVDERANRATVESEHPHERNPPYAVQVVYDVTAPAGTSVTIQSLAGNISAAGLAGELAAVTATGNVVIRDVLRLSRARSATGLVHLANVETEGTLEAGTIAGAITIEMARARRLLIGTVTGAVTARNATADRAEVTTTAGSIEYAGTIATNGRYELRAHTGDIRFVPLGEAGFELRASTFSGRILPAANLGLAILRKGARDIVGTVGDGRAVVTLATFNGDIVIERR